MCDSCAEASAFIEDLDFAAALGGTANTSLKKKKSAAVTPSEFHQSTYHFFGEKKGKVVVLETNVYLFFFLKVLVWTFLSPKVQMTYQQEQLSSSAPCP